MMLNKQELILIALKLNSKDIFNFCRSSKKINNAVCENRYFWIEKLKKDFNFIFSNKKRNPKNYYLLLESDKSLSWKFNKCMLLGYIDLLDYISKKIRNDEKWNNVLKQVGDLYNPLTKK